MIRLTMEVMGLDAVDAYIAGTEARLRSAVAAAMRTSMLPIAKAAAQAAPVDQGTLRASIAANGVQVVQGESSVAATIGPGMNARKYAAPVEFGTLESVPYKAGPNPGELKAAIREWVHRHAFALKMGDVYRFRKTKAGGYIAGRRKGVSASAAFRAENSLAYVIARRIATEGLKPNEYLLPAWRAGRQGVLDAIRAAVASAMGGG